MQQEKKYPIGGYAPGNYQCHCATCGGSFKGDKRAVQCEPCAISDRAKFDALSPDEQQELMQRNAKIIKEVFSHGVNSNDFIESGGLWKARALAAELELEELKKRQGAVWVKGAPKDYKQYFARVPGVIDDDRVYEAVIWPIEGCEHWWCIGHGFKFSVHRDKIISHIDESGQSKEGHLSNEVVHKCVNENQYMRIALYETRISLYWLLKSFSDAPKNDKQQKYYAQADAMLNKHFEIKDVLRTDSKEGNKDLEGMEKAQFDNWHRWLSDNGYTYDGEYYYDEDNSYYTHDQLWAKFK